MAEVPRLDYRELWGEAIAQHVAASSHAYALADALEDLCESLPPGDVPDSARTALLAWHEDQGS